MEPEKRADRGNVESLLQTVKDNLRDAYGLEELQIDQLAQSAVSGIRHEFAELDLAVRRQDPDQVQALAHSLKGILLNLGLKRQAAIAERLQHHATLQEEEPGRLMARLREGLSQFVD